MSGEEWEKQQRLVFFEHVRDTPEILVLLLGDNPEISSVVRCSKHKQWYMRNGATCPICEEHEEVFAPVEFVE